MPVFDLCRDNNNRTGCQAYRLFARLLIPSLTGGTDQDLTAAAFSVVDMPVVPTPRLKGNIRQKNRTTARLSQRVQIGTANEILGIGGIGLPQTEHIFLMESLFVLNTHDIPSFLPCFDYRRATL